MLTSPAPATISLAVAFPIGSELLRFGDAHAWLLILATMVLLLSAALIVVTRAALREKSRNAETALQRAQDEAEVQEIINRIGQGDYSDVNCKTASDGHTPLASALCTVLPSIRSTISRLERASRHDQLTDLLNSTSFKNACQAIIGIHSGPGGVLLYFDVNDFKKINDSLGHNAGDKFLKTCADRIRLAAESFKLPKMQALTAGQSITDLDPIIGRLGGDEFGIFLPGVNDRAEVEKFVMRIKRMIGEPCHIGSHSLRAKVSVGAAFSADHNHVYDRLLTAADTAMYAAKAAGDAGMAFYDPTMHSSADRKLEAELELRNALQKGQFKLHFQPQINISTNRIVGAEALIRWEHPSRGLVMPSEFMPFAEAHGLIDDFGDWVINEAIRSAAKWWQAGHKIKIAVNISPRQLKQVELIAIIRACLKRHDLPPHALEVEFTEEALMLNDDVAMERIEGLRRDGVSIALDDFGTGYSNIAQLLALPMDVLKLDRSLLRASASDRRRRAVLLAILSLAKKLGFTVISEGVETEAQRAFLKSAGFHIGQGYFFARPMPDADFTKLLETHATEEATAAA